MNESAEKLTRKESLQRVNDEDKNAGGFTEDAKHICRADIPAADGANINAARLRDEKSRRNGSDKIRQHDQRDVAHNVHILNVETKTPNLKVQTAA